MGDRFPSDRGQDDPNATRRGVLGMLGAGTVGVGLGLAGCQGSLTAAALDVPNVTYPSTDQHPLVGHETDVSRGTVEFAEQEGEVKIVVDFFAYDWSGSDFQAGTLLAPGGEVADIPVTKVGDASVEELLSSAETRESLLTGLHVDPEVAQATTDVRQVDSRAVANPAVFATDDEVLAETWLATGEESAVLLDVAKGPLSFETVAADFDRDAVFGTGVSKVYDTASAAATSTDDATPTDDDGTFASFVEKDANGAADIHDRLLIEGLDVLEDSSDHVVTDLFTTTVVSPTATPRKPGPRTITGPPSDGMESFDEEIPALMDEWEIPGGVVGVVKDGRLVFVHGYGKAVRESDPAASGSELVRPDSRFRIASVSKPITAVTVLDLIEEGGLALDDPAVDYLGDLLPSGGLQDGRVRDVTVRHLLRHTGGWDKDARGWDPMFSGKKIANAEGTTPPAEPDTIIEYMFERDLNFDPGTQFAYSNFGYCLLGRVVESVTGRGYEEYVSSEVLGPMGIGGMEVGATRSRASDEVRYYGNDKKDSVFPGEGKVRSPYGSFYLEAMDAHGGWVAPVADVLRFLLRADDRGPVSDVLASSTFDTMTERPSVPRWQGEDRYYGMGLRVFPEQDNWWHYGSLPGTSAIVVRAGRDGLGWAAMMNSRPQNWGDFNTALDKTIWDAVRSVSDWPDRDLFSRFG
jgi:N-acyl-D-amino-acid deacylase